MNDAESVFDSSRGQNIAWQCISSIDAPTTLLIIFMTQRRMGLDSRTTNRAFQCVMAQEIKLCILIWNAMHIIKQRDSTSIILNSRGEACMQMECNLDVEAKYAKCACKACDNYASGKHATT